MRKKNNWLKNWLVLFIVLAGLFFAVKFYWNNQNAPVNINDKDVVSFVITPGEGSSQVAERLEVEGLIKSANIFKLKLFLDNSLKIEAGDFKLSPSMSTNEILKALSKGSTDKWVTVIEGLRNEEVAQKLNQELGINEEQFLAAANGKQGYLFPDTYLFNPNALPSDIALKMEENFNSKVTDEMVSQFSKQGLTLEEAVILASLVEREGRSDKVRTEVAGVLLKRLNMGMKLDIDATVQYAKDSENLARGFLDKFWKPISRADYKGVISPYNTYLNNGLPPGPISNPSLSSLEAVANASPNTPYLYYYHDSEGNSHYARTLEEHNENVATYP